MFTVTVQGESLAEVQAKLLAAADALNGVGKSTADDAPKPAPKSADKPKPAAKPEPETEDDDDPGLDYEKDVQPHVAGLGTAHGKQAALDVLKAFDNAETGEPATKATQVAPEHWPALVKKAKAAKKKLDAAKAAAEEDE